NPPYCRNDVYGDLKDLRKRHRQTVRSADAVVLGSYVQNGVEVGTWVAQEARGTTAFYDIDTPVTLAKLQRGDFEYVSPDLIPQFDIYLSFTGGPTLEVLKERYGAQEAKPLYCSFDPAHYYPEQTSSRWDLGYLGTYSDDRQPPLEELMLNAAREAGHRRFVVAGPQYPGTVRWPDNVERIDHLPPSEHRAFYNAQRFTLNITRADMRRMGYAPSVRLFEAAACGTPIISDEWPGLDKFFRFDEEILISRSKDDTLRYLREVSEDKRRSIGQKARERVLAEHTSAHRAQELENYLRDRVFA
ncbi:MAG: CgeB family protein, partial [Fimbriimonadaceae bacterium]